MNSESHPAIVFVVDDDEAVRDSLRWVIESAGFKVKTYPSAGEFLKKLDPSQSGCLVLDVRMPEMSGLQLQKLLSEKNNPLPVIFISAHGSVPDAVGALHGGAIDFLMKPFDNQILLERIERSIKLDRKRRETRQQQEEIAQRVAQLTSRERQVMELIVKGKPNKVVAIELGISTKTVEIHRARVMEKLEAKNLADLIHLARFLEDTNVESSPN
ncbi:response regulator receiver [Nitrosococcus halophilus Nc 4]|uniref:Response regulator receiver n=1 Tax=Nitrosococcus halophilus (strain Nc4) TaxID=472759 RepID=D5BXF7_NITHN|nr:response regulator transcription factor [Nitrosococcus halophilus]ADE13915.1 response regulator receiver [Nitrosococcus halophilus Nc 4]